MAGRRSKGDQRAARAEAERSRLYAARSQWHSSQKRRRVVDNTIAGIVGGLLLVGVVISQSVHAHVSAPKPTPTQTSTPAPTAPATPSSTPSTSPTSTPAP